MLDYIQCVLKVDYPPSLRNGTSSVKHCIYTNPFNRRASAIIIENAAHTLGWVKG